MMMSHLLAVFALISLIYTASSVNPGVKLRISQYGINYAGQVAIDILGGNLQGQRIPDQSGSSHVAVGKVEYTMSGMSITSFSKPSSSVVVKTGQGFTWSGSGGSIAAHGDWKYKYKAGFIHISDHGHFDISVSGMNFAVSVTLGDLEGAPSIRSTGCSCDIQTVHVKFHGGASWLYNLFDHDVAKTLRHHMNDLFCSAATKAINEQAEKSLAKMKLKVPIGGILTLDYSLVQAPVFGQGYMDSFHKGEVFWTGDSTESTLVPPVIPNISNNTKMLYIWLSDYVMDTMGQVLHKHGVLDYTLTRADLPPKEQYLLNTSCSLVCVGTSIYQLHKLFPNCDVEMHMHTTQPPVLDVAPGHINGKFVGLIDNYVHFPNGTKTYVFSMDLTVSFSLSVKMTGKLITAQVQTYSFNVSVTKTKIGPIGTGGIQWLFNTAAKQFIVQKLNVLGAKGFELPSIDNAEYVHPELQLMKDVVLLSTDILYKPSNGIKNKKLKFTKFNEYKMD